MILVINKSQQFNPYTLQYMLFEDADEDMALAYAKAEGYNNPLHDKAMRPGMMYVSMGGDVDISMIKLEVQVVGGGK